MRSSWASATICAASSRPDSTTASRRRRTSSAWSISSGQLRAELVEQAEHLGAVDDAGGGHRHRAGALDEGDELVEGVVDGHGGDVSFS